MKGCEKDVGKKIEGPHLSLFNLCTNESFESLEKYSLIELLWWHREVELRKNEPLREIFFFAA